MSDVNAVIVQPFKQFVKGPAPPPVASAALGGGFR